MRSWTRRAWIHDFGMSGQSAKASASRSFRVVRPIHRQSKAMQEGLHTANRQATAAEQALEHAKDSLGVSEGAYIGIGPISVVGGQLIGGVPTQYAFDLVIGGKTPAFDVFASTRDFTSAQFSIELVTELEKRAEVRSRLAPIIGKYLMAGKAEPADPVRPPSADITPTHMADVIAGNERLVSVYSCRFRGLSAKPTPRIVPVLLRP
jgi:hypothetical protein